MHNDQVCCFQLSLNIIIKYLKMHQQRFFKVWSFRIKKKQSFIQLKTERIYICGGFNGQECMNSAEYFDPKTNQWTIIAPMRNRRSGIGVIAYHNSIYALFVSEIICLFAWNEISSLEVVLMVPHGWIPVKDTIQKPILGWQYQICIIQGVILRLKYVMIHQIEIKPAFLFNR